jgi:hypothetical protein
MIILKNGDQIMKVVINAMYPFKCDGKEIHSEKQNDIYFISQELYDQLRCEGWVRQPKEVDGCLKN